MYVYLYTIYTYFIWTFVCVHTHTHTRAHMRSDQKLSSQYSEVVIVHAFAFQSTLLGCQFTSMLCKLFSLY